MTTRMHAAAILPSLLHVCILLVPGKTHSYILHMLSIKIMFTFKISFVSQILMRNWGQMYIILCLPENVNYFAITKLKKAT